MIRTDCDQRERSAAYASISSIANLLRDLQPERHSGDVFGRFGLFLISSIPLFKAQSDPPPPKKSRAGHFRLTSPNFNKGGDIPRKYTCQSTDVSPEFHWTAPPMGTRSFALVVDDPDAPTGTWVHWVIFNIPANQRKLSEGQPQSEEVTGGARQGKNSFGRLGYGGPCPPAGSSHRYFFRLYALNDELALQPGASKEEVLHAAQGHILATAELMAHFKD